MINNLFKNKEQEAFNEMMNSEYQEKIESRDYVQPNEDMNDFVSLEKETGIDDSELIFESNICVMDGLECL